MNSILRMIKTTFIKISELGVKKNHDFLLIKEIRLMNIFNICTALVGLSYTFLLLLINEPFLAIFDVALSICAVIAILLNFAGKHNFATIFTFLFLPAFLISIGYFYAGAGCEYYLFPFIVILAYMKKPKRILGFFVVLYILSFWIIKYFESTVEVDETVQTLGTYFLYSNVTASTILLFLFIRLFIVEYEANRNTINQNNVILSKINSELLEKNKKIQILVKEISHRTKNNLQLISSMINLQSHEITDNKLKHILHDIRSRIFSIALVHKKLYLSNSDHKISLHSYISELCSSIKDSLCDEDSNTKLLISSDNIYADIDIVVHLGIIVNEIITNSIKHGLKNSNEKTIKVIIRQPEKSIIKLIVYDSGTGINKLNDSNEIKFGFSLVKNILHQYQADLKIYENKGNYIEITLKLKDEKEELITENYY